MIRVRGLSKSFGALHAVRNLDFEAGEGRITSIIGPNGAGKSTAFNLIAGTLRPDEGRVEYQGADVTGLAPYVLASRGIARSFQISNLFFGLTTLENVRLACQAREPRKTFLTSLRRMGEVRRRAAAVVERFELSHAADELVRNLSHGDQRRLEIAVCMALEPRVLMLDEPTQGMSPAETAEVDTLIKSLAGNVTVLMIEHDIDLVMNISDHVIVLHQGQKLFEGRPADVVASRAVREAYLGGADAAP
jgi:branched-chain amino acid transport system ATP-binding protein